MNLTYSELEDFLAEMHDVAPEKRIALRGRLKHFQRLGWPAGTNQGKGARVQYGLGQTLSLSIGMEMLQLGLTPERVVQQMGYSSSYLPNGFEAALDARADDRDQILYVFAPESLYTLRGRDEEQPGIQSLLIAKSKLPELAHVPPFAGSNRYAVINLSELLYDYLSYFQGRKFEDETEVRAAIKNWQAVAKQQMRARGVVFADGEDEGEHS